MPGFSDNWALQMNIGQTSYYGDLSTYDRNFAGKLEYESGLGIGIAAHKQLGKVFSLSGQIIGGSLNGQKNEFKMKSRLLEYNLHLKMDLVQLLAYRQPSKLGVNFIAGVGNFLFDTDLTEYYEGGEKTTNSKSRVPEFVWLLGGDIFYNISDNTYLSLEMTIKRFQNDKIDAVVAGTEYDYYSFFSIGIGYRINRLFPVSAKRADKTLNKLSPYATPLYRPQLSQLR
ncbi:MAG: hypothetical protein Kow00127_02530 [Bacteroidales bacterium]